MPGSNQAFLFGVGTFSEEVFRQLQTLNGAYHASGTDCPFIALHVLARNLHRHPMKQGLLLALFYR